MRQPRLSDVDNGDGTYDYEEYQEAMGNFADSERDREVEEKIMEDESIAEEEIWNDRINGNYRDAREKMVKNGVTGLMLLEYLDFTEGVELSPKVEEIIKMLDGIISEYQDGIFTAEEK